MDSNIVNQYDLLRRQAATQAQQNLDLQKKGLARQFAANGLSNSGAAIQADQNASNNIMGQLQNSNDAIGFAQADAQTNQDNIKQAQQYATSERIGAQNFATAQAAADYAQQTKERIANNDFYAGLQTAASTQAQKNWDKQFGQDQDVIDFNKHLATRIQDSNEKGLLGDLGGTGGAVGAGAVGGVPGIVASKGAGGNWEKYINPLDPNQPYSKYTNPVGGSADKPGPSTNPGTILTNLGTWDGKLNPFAKMGQAIITAGNGIGRAIPKPKF